MRVCRPEHYLRECVDSAMLSVSAFVSNGNKSLAKRNVFELSPAFRCMQSINATSPLIVLSELRRMDEGRQCANVCLWK